jgi:hypothetical protein
MPGQSQTLPRNGDIRKLNARRASIVARSARDVVFGDGNLSLVSERTPPCQSDDINLQAGKLHVRRSKGGETSVHPLGARDLMDTMWMVNQYPDDIRNWIEAKGGVAKMPLNTFWTLPASDLWQMGYRRCAD